MRKISADYIFPISSSPIKNGVVVVNDDGTILEILNPQSPIPNLQSPIPNPQDDIEYFHGIICPGFVNAHCHLELSYMRSRIEEQKGLAQFIREVEKEKKNVSNEEIQDAIVEAEEEMLMNGIVAVGDISNTNITFEQKAKSKLKYHTFIEVFGIHPNQAEKAFEAGVNLFTNYSRFLGIRITNTKNQQSSIVNQQSINPHAPYSASVELLQKINDFAFQNNSIISMHNQESEEENKLFRLGEGKILERIKDFGIDTSFLKPTGKSSLQSTLVHLNKCRKIQLVHNTFTSKEDIAWLHSPFTTHHSLIYFCFCPNANLYIENTLPDFHLFIDANANITVGTDSLASNKCLSVLEELKTISQHASQIPLDTLLSWATKNGAEFLEFNELGTIEKGKTPGLNLIQNVDLQNMRLIENSSVQPIQPQNF